LINYGNSCNIVFGVSGITANTWHHYVIVKETSSTSSLYIDGIKQTALTSGQDYWGNTVSNVFQVGGRGGGTLFNG